MLITLAVFPNLSSHFPYAEMVMSSSCASEMLLDIPNLYVALELCSLFRATGGVAKGQEHLVLLVLANLGVLAL